MIGRKANTRPVNLRVFVLIGNDQEDNSAALLAVAAERLASAIIQ